jgi:hypothetical protein
MKRNLLILLATLLFSYSLIGCGSETVVAVNVENEENIHNTTFGENAFIKIGNGLWYDSTTRIVYLWNGSMTYGSQSSTTPSPYYAPNGFPYKYNPETNTFEEIEK